MNKFLKIENDGARFSHGQCYSQEVCREQLVEFQRAVEAFRAEKVRENNLGRLRAIFRDLGVIYRGRSDGSFFAETPNHPTIFTPNDAGECLVEHDGKNLVVSLDDHLDALVEQVKGFLKPERYRKLEVGEIIRAGDQYYDDGLWYEAESIGWTVDSELDYRRPFLPNSFTASNFSITNNH